MQYIPKHFAMDQAAALAHIDAHPLAQLVSHTDGLHLSQLPMVRDGNTLLGHLAAANPHAAVVGGAATAVFHGPNGYISPRWYAPGQVPTWNYRTVTVQGTARVITDPARAMAVVDTLVAAMEAQVPGTPWQADWQDPRTRRLLDHIVVFELPMEQVQGKAKLSQNRSASDRAGAVAGLRALGQTDLADAMDSAG